MIFTFIISFDYHNIILLLSTYIYLIYLHFIIILWWISPWINLISKETNRCCLIMNSRCFNRTRYWVAKNCYDLPSMIRRLRLWTNLIPFTPISISRIFRFIRKDLWKIKYTLNLINITSILEEGTLSAKYIIKINPIMKKINSKTRINQQKNIRCSFVSEEWRSSMIYSLLTSKLELAFLHTIGSWGEEYLKSWKINFKKVELSLISIAFLKKMESIAKFRM